MPKYDPSKYKKMKANREKQLQNEFLSKYKSRVDKNGQIKAPPDRNLSDGWPGEDDDIFLDDNKNDKEIEKKCKS